MGSSFIEGISPDPIQYLAERNALVAQAAARQAIRDAELAEQLRLREEARLQEQERYNGLIADRDTAIEHALATRRMRTAELLPGFVELFDRARVIIDHCPDIDRNENKPSRVDSTLSLYSKEITLAEIEGVRQTLEVRTVSRRQGRREPFLPYIVRYTPYLIDASGISEQLSPAMARRGVLVNGQYVMQPVIQGETISLPHIVEIDGKRTDLEPVLEIVQMDRAFSVAEATIGIR